MKIIPSKIIQILKFFVLSVVDNCIYVSSGESNIMNIKKGAIKRLCKICMKKSCIEICPYARNSVSKCQAQKAAK